MDRANGGGFSVSALFSGDNWADLPLKYMKTPITFANLALLTRVTYSIQDLESGVVRSAGISRLAT